MGNFYLNGTASFYPSEDMLPSELKGYHLFRPEPDEEFPGAFALFGLSTEPIYEGQEPVEPREDDRFLSPETAEF